MEEESGAPALTSPTAGSAIHEQISGHAAAAAGAITSTAAAVHSGLGLVATEIKDELFTSFKFWGAPTRGAFDRAWLTHKSPRGANCLERHRDGWLRFMLRFRKTFQYLTICSLITMITFAVIVTVAAFGTQMGFTMGEFTAYTVAACDIRQYNVSDVLYPQNYDPSAFCFGKDCPDGNPYTAAPKLLLQFVPRVRGHGVYTKATGDETGMGDYVAHYCTDAQFLFNVCVKFFTIWGTYFNVIPMPWTFSIFFHAWCPHAEAKGKLGVDFYGRPTKSIYFHTTHRNQKIVSTILTLALLDQIPDFIFIFIFPTYLDAGTWPGQFLTGIWFLVQIAMQAIAAVVQNCAEEDVRIAHPGKFPPSFNKYIKRAYASWHAEHKEEIASKGCMSRIRLFWCHEHSFKKFVLDEFKEMKADSDEYARANGTGYAEQFTGVQADDVGKLAAPAFKKVAMGAKLKANDVSNGADKL